MKEPLRALMEKIDTERARAHALGNHDYESGLVFAWNDLVTLHAARQSAPALVTARDAHFFEAGVAEGKRLAAEDQFAPPLPELECPCSACAYLRRKQAERHSRRVALALTPDPES